MWTGGTLPWPAIVADPANRLSGKVEGNLLRPTPSMDADNLLREQVIATAAEREATAPRGAGDAPFWLPAEDVPVPTRGGKGRPVTMRALFAALRANGLVPHPWGPEEDRRVAADWVDRATTAGRRAAAASPDSFGPGTPNPSIGLAEAAFARTFPATAYARAAYPRGGPSDFQRSVTSAVGNAYDTIGDAAAMGAGRVRRLHQSDVTYGAVFPYYSAEVEGDFYLYGAMVQSPSTLLHLLRVSPEGDRWGRLLPSQSMILHALLMGVKVDLNPFNGGGGYTGNYSGGRGQAATDTVLVLEPAFGAPVYGTHLWGDIIASTPPWQFKNGTPRFLVCSGEGWSPFYYLDPSALYPPTDAAYQPIYQQYALNVWPAGHSPVLHARGVTVDEYSMEVARRKGLAVAAFATGLAEWLGSLHRSLLSVDPTSNGVYDVVDTIEVGNELDGYWDNTPEHGSPNVSVYEVGRYLALLAGPIHDVLSDMRFRFELHAWAPTLKGAPPFDNFADQVAWLDSVVTTGLAAETADWAKLQRYQAQAAAASLGAGPGPAEDADAEAWLATCAAAGFQWPPQIFKGGSSGEEIREAIDSFVPVRPSGLLHEVSEHWYHWSDTDPGGAITGESRLLYDGTNRLAADLSVLRGVGRSVHRTLSISAGEMGFPARSPGDPGDRRWGAPYYANANEKFQAAMHVRYLATSLACGATSANIFTFNFGAVPSTKSYEYGYRLTSWENFYTMGIHNDVIVSESYLQAPDCWARPTWYAIRRFSWLQGLSSTLTLEYARDGLTVVRCEFASWLPFPSADGSRTATSFARAFLIWLDQYATQSCGAAGTIARSSGTATVAFKGPPFYELLSLVPDVVPQAAPECGPRWCVDARGYPLPSAAVAPNPNWNWTGWDAARLRTTYSPGGFAVGVAMADPLSVIAPLCVLTNAEFLGAF